MVFLAGCFALTGVETLLVEDVQSPQWSVIVSSVNGTEIHLNLIPASDNEPMFEDEHQTLFARIPYAKGMPLRFAVVGNSLRGTLRNEAWRCGDRVGTMARMDYPWVDLHDKRESALDWQGAGRWEALLFKMVIHPDYNAIPAASSIESGLFFTLQWLPESAAKAPCSLFISKPHITVREVGGNSDR